MLRTAKPTGCRTIDMKMEIEEYLSSSAIPYSALRTGTYMDDFTGTQLESMPNGRYAPIISDRARLCLTDPRDISQVTIALLDRPLSDHVDIIDPTVYTINDIQACFQRAFRPNSTVRLFLPARLVNWALVPIKILNLLVTHN
ncbi:unnamed protein product [Rotaria sp. Silwood2]|nr:unnamed protein product [Rotaria sp. Silwood2]CAF4289201.1 unnamed protein product [Rotaria sp. Silwood2]